jgi:hypothetical protein
MDEETNEDSKYSSSRRKSALARRRPASFPSRKSRAWLAAESRADSTKDKNVAEDRDFTKFLAFHEVPPKPRRMRMGVFLIRAQSAPLEPHLVQSRPIAR